MQRLSLSIFTALAALLLGIAIGHYALPHTKTSSSSQKQTALLPERAVIFSNNPPPSAAKSALPSGADFKEPELDPSSKTLIAGLQSALSQSGSRRSYAAFSKLTDSINEKNVHEVIAFAEGVSKPQDKST